MTKMNISAFALAAALAAPAAIAQTAPMTEHDTVAETPATDMAPAAPMADTENTWDATGGADAQIGTEDPAVTTSGDAVTQPSAMAGHDSVAVVPHDVNTAILGSAIMNHTVYSVVHDTNDGMTGAMGASTTDTLGTDAAVTTTGAADGMWGTRYDSVPGEWESIADISDLLISAEGQVIGYVVDVGGFLGMGARSVALDVNAVTPVMVGDEGAFTVSMSREELEALPEIQAD